MWCAATHGAWRRPVTVTRCPMGVEMGSDMDMEKSIIYVNYMYVYVYKYCCIYVYVHSDCAYVWVWRCGVGCNRRLCAPAQLLRGSQVTSTSSARSQPSQYFTLTPPKARSPLLVFRSVTSRSCTLLLLQNSRSRAIDRESSCSELAVSMHHACSACKQNTCVSRRHVIHAPHPPPPSLQSLAGATRSPPHIC